MKKILSFLWRCKFASLLVLAIIAAGGYFGYQKFLKPTASQVEYATEAVSKGIIVSSVSGSGQVSASSQVDISPKVSGTLVSVNVVAGQKVKEGDLIAQIDSRDAARQVSEARAGLETAKLDLKELLAPVDSYTLLQAENSLASARDSLSKLKITQANNLETNRETKAKAEDNLEKSYTDAFNDIADVFLDLPTTITGLYTILYSDEIASAEQTVSPNSNTYALANSISDSNKKSEFQKYAQIAQDNYWKAKNSYDANYENYKQTSRYSSNKDIEVLLKETMETTKEMTEAIKSQINMIEFWIDYRTKNNQSIFSQVSEYQSDLNSYTGGTNSHLSTLLGIQQTIKDYQEDISTADRDLAEMEQNNPLDLAAAERSVAEKEENLADLKAGATELEIRNKELAVTQKENSLLQAQQNYADYFIRAPFDGVIAEINSSKGDSVGSGTTVATIITDQKIAAITLNEIDAAQVKAGQKAALSFDAVPDLSITGEVAEVDALGTIASGVVSYDVKIVFDVQDERIKPGMSASVDIITESRVDVLRAPIGAVKTQGDASYAEVLTNGQPKKKTVTTGLSSDTMIEITSGLEEGEQIITQTKTNGADGAQTKSSGQNERPGGMMGIF
ncbi:MAG: hypothetical protein COV91_04335 [Candidatus Taylorbacteria bacterium CG11_big_fil_rev_8_21_14_0_20_46_11]|uniref:Uncharacterized protein n=1 Tax=Candidatus Taylorbacteria bacterium CG11_big_fil_rev_8_21_14_0_20_46_11 TaxID=1975025 RepID=A0A2H0KDD3_9BACT|nr:MAG: hypothetical protein COV91_04335 [Candidatus Taylorbacteria bacterium CG11_big_fil_rev_8_21_14_0_20_46_11]